MNIKHDRHNTNTLLLYNVYSHLKSTDNGRLKFVILTMNDCLKPWSDFYDCRL